MAIKFFDLLGVADSAAAALLLPRTVTLSRGLPAVDDRVAVAAALQQWLRFDNVRFGIDSASHRITVAADIHLPGLTAAAAPLFGPLYLAPMSDIGISIQATPEDDPPKIFFTYDGTHWELVIESLPVAIAVDAGILAAPDNNSADATPADFHDVDPDSFVPVLGYEPLGSRLYAMARLQFLDDGAIVLETSVPMSVGDSRLFGLPLRSVYDLGFITAPQHREYYEWLRHDLDPNAKGALAIRSLDFDLTKEPLDQLDLEDAELVCEDIALPLVFPPDAFPVFLHGTFGIRQAVANVHDVNAAYDLTAAPIKISFAKSSSKDPKLVLAVSRALFRTGIPEIILDAAIYWKTEEAQPNQGATVSITDDWTVRAGWRRWPTGKKLFTIADSEIRFHGFKAGVSLGRLSRHEPFSQSWEVLADFSVTPIPNDPTKPAPAWQIKDIAGQSLATVYRDIGWSLGRPTLGSLENAQGLQISYAKAFRLRIEEMGWVEEPGGSSYFSFTGGVALGFADGEKGAPENGLRFRRLRFRTRDDPHAPLIKLDGIFLNLHWGKVTIDGFGYMSDFVQGSWKINEWGLGAKVSLKGVFGKDLDIAAQFFKGRREDITTHAGFNYFLAALSVDGLKIPLGAVMLDGGKAVFAQDLIPNAGKSDDGEGMALYRWYLDGVKPLDVDDARDLSINWKPKDRSLCAGIGARLSFPASPKAARIDLLLFLAHTEDDTAVLAVGELFLLKNKKPVAWVGIEYDFKTEKLGVLIGVDISVAEFAGGTPQWIKDLARLSGTLYFGNQPWTIAIGHLADQRSWLGIRAHYGGFITLDFSLIVCAELVDGGPKGFGLVFSLSGGSNWGIGAFTIYGSFGFIVGCWKTGADTFGAEIWIQFGFRIRVFRVFTFGADLTVRLTYLGKLPWFTTLSGSLRIHVSRWLPTLTFSFQKTWGSLQPFQTVTLRRPLESGEAHGLPQEGPKALHLPPLTGTPTPFYSFDDLLMRQAGQRDATLVPVVPTNATIAINFSVPVTNDMAVAPTTPGDPGSQRVQDITLRHGLKSVSVRRAPRYGAHAGQWEDFIKPADTELDAGGTLHVAPSLSFRWQLDTRADGKHAPLQLLLNASSPYSVASGGSQEDEEVLRNDPGSPCCKVTDEIPMEHVLSFENYNGVRLPRQQQFSGGGAMWHWSIDPPPFASADPAGPPVYARMDDLLHTRMLGSVEFDEPVVSAHLQTILNYNDIGAAYAPILVLETFHGLDLLQHQEMPVDGGHLGNFTFTATADRAITRLVMRTLGPNEGYTFYQSTNVTAPVILFTFSQISYVTAAESLRVRGATIRCRNSGGANATGGAGTLSFLANHDYEIAVTTEVRVSSASQGTRSFTLTEPFYFTTRGLPGLNATPNVGDELAPMVESTYPPSTRVPLYRTEPIALAFTEEMSTLLPIDRVAAPGDPPERAQLVELGLSVDRIGSLDGLGRLTVPSSDWITANGGTAPADQEGAIAQTRTGVRKATTSNPRLLRFERILASSPQCNVDPLHKSQVLLHDPVGNDGTPGPWPALTTLRAIVRLKDGPFTRRTSFGAADVAAFTYQFEDGSAAPAWSVDSGGQLVSSASGTLQYALLGDPTWNHLQLRARVDPGNGSAGAAIGVGAGQAILATVETVGTERRLFLRRRAGGSIVASNDAAIEGTTGAVMLTVEAFDDRVRAVVGETVVEIDRDVVREGRVALVAGGAAQFAAVEIDALDMYRFDFASSQFDTFAQHIGSYRGSASAVDLTALGAGATIASWFTANEAARADAMQPAADPQTRQSLFSALVASAAVPLHQKAERVGVTRLVDASGTSALLLESPELIAFSSDVTATLTRYEPISPLLPLDPIQAALAQAKESADDFPEAGTAARTIGRPPGSRPRPYNPVPVPIRVLTNGDETVAVLIPNAAMLPGIYVLRLSITRSRWRTGTAAADSAYHDETFVPVSW